MSVDFRSMIDDCYARLGETASYQPLVGDEVDILVIPAGQDRFSSFNSTKIQSAGALMVEVRVNQLVQPAAGDTIVYNGDNYKVKNFSLVDQERLVWSLDLYRV